MKKQGANFVLRPVDKRREIKDLLCVRSGNYVDRLCTEVWITEAECG